MEHERIWSLVLNSTRARIVRGLGAHPEENAAELVLVSQHRKLKDIMADKPGRTSSPIGGRRAAMGYSSDPVRDDERKFADEVVAVLEAHRRAGDFQGLAIFSSPEMLGILRPKLVEPLITCIRLEVTKNLINESETDLKRIISDYLSAA
ncbi:protein required for attachment to host cells [mine drainage metagenome]|uniref:Protein required for attachment to host cells n=1 Tax=mine drainage metagenome TaxID=410659 RepID=A0A1J5PDW2_9ZZZZ